MESVKYKACASCKLDLPSSMFGKDARASSGLQSSCKACCNAKKRASYQTDKPAAQQKRKAYYASHKTLVLEINRKSRSKHIVSRKTAAKAYYDSVKNKDWFKAKCALYVVSNKAAKQAYDRQYRQENFEHLSDCKKRWLSKNKDKRRLISHTYKAKRRSWVAEGISTKALHEWEMKQVKKCHWCNVACDSGYHIDHYMPLAKGGKHEESNLVIACARCNLRKNAKHPLDFLALINQQSKENV